MIKKFAVIPDKAGIFVSASNLNTNSRFRNSLCATRGTEGRDGFFWVQDC